MQTILKNRVNSGNATVSNGYANPEPSRKYTSERCRDYRRGSDLLITGIERPTSQVDDDIVHALQKCKDYHALDSYIGLTDNPCLLLL